MARPYKQGVDYYSLDVDFLKDIKYRKIRKSCGPQTCEILLCLLSYIYGDMGYFLRWDEDSAFLVADDVGAKEGLVEEVVNKAVQVGFFDHDKYQKYKILTSNGIQKRYKLMTSKRKEVVLQEEYLIIDGNNSLSPVVYDVNNSPSTVVNGVNNTQREKERESKVNKSKVNKKETESSINPSSPETTVEKAFFEESLSEENFTENNTKNIYSVEQSSTMSELFEKVWKTYPKKTNKKKAKEQFLKKIKSDEDFERFKTGYKAYLKYIKLNDWYHPQELFRWIRDERFNDEYDLSETTTQARYTNPPVRQEQLPDWVNEPKQEEEKLSPEEQAELDRQIKDFLEGK